MYTILYEGAIRKHLIVFPSEKEMLAAERIRSKTLVHNELKYWVDFINRLKKDGVLFTDVTIDSVRGLYDQPLEAHEQSDDYKFIKSIREE